MVEDLVRKDRTMILGSLACVVAAAWAWLLVQPVLGGMYDDAGATAASSVPVHAFKSFGEDVFNWFVMMAAVMLPSATPMILALARAVRARDPSANPVPPTVIFAGVYLAAWGVGALAGAALQDWAIDADVIWPASLAIKDGGLIGLVLAVFGFYQLTPLKRESIEICRAPPAFHQLRWGDGPVQPYRLGLLYVLSCAGACWVMLPLVFVGGVMNLSWVALIASLIVVEKAAPAGPIIGRIVGAGSAMTGIGVMVATALERYP